MSALLRHDVLAWLAAFLLSGSGLLAGRHILHPRDLLARAARWCAGLGGYLLLLSLLARGVVARGWPLVSTYEVLLATAAALALFYALGLPHRLAGLGGLSGGALSALMTALALLLTPGGARVPQPPPLALQGVLFPLHVAASAIGYSGLLLAGCAALLRLPIAQSESPSGPSEERADRAETPSSSSLITQLEELSRRGLDWGYPWLTLGMALGIYWSWQAWGRTWTWSSKEILTLLTWGLFTLAFHTRRQRGWRGWPHRLVLLSGLLALLLTLLAAEALAGRVLPGLEYVF